MDAKIENRDMVIDSTLSPVMCKNEDEILQRIFIACSMKKGSFILDKTLGSFAYTVDLDDPMLCEKLTMIYKEATVEIPYSDLEVVSVDKTKTPPIARIKVLLNSEVFYTEVTVNE